MSGTPNEVGVSHNQLAQSPPGPTACRQLTGQGTCIGAPGPCGAGAGRRGPGDPGRGSCPHKVEHTIVPAGALDKEYVASGWGQRDPVVHGPFMTMQDPEALKGI